MANTIKFLENDFRFDKELPYFTYNRPNKNDNTAHTIKLKIKPGMAFGEKPERLSAKKAFSSFIFG